MIVEKLSVSSLKKIAYSFEEYKGNKKTVAFMNKARLIEIITAKNMTEEQLKELLAKDNKRGRKSKKEKIKDLELETIETEESEEKEENTESRELTEGEKVKIIGILKNKMLSNVKIKATQEVKSLTGKNIRECYTIVESLIEQISGKKPILTPEKVTEIVKDTKEIEIVTPVVEKPIIVDTPKRELTTAEYDEITNDTKEETKSITEGIKVIEEPIKEKLTEMNKPDTLAVIMAREIEKHITVKSEVDLSEGKLSSLLDEKVKSYIDSHVEKKEIKMITINNKKTDISCSHKDLTNILSVVNAGLYPMLVGPTGSGKTHVASQIAKILEVDFHCESVCRQTTKTDLLGYMDANGNYHESKLYKAFKYGGLYLLDEMDRGNENVMLVLNSATSNGFCHFPSGERIEKHEKFYLIAAANTFGRGADMQYVGANRLDAASLNRFITMFFDYDKHLESNIIKDITLLELFHRVRFSIDELKEKVTVSTRNIMQAETLKNLAFSESEILDMTVFKGCNKELKTRIKNHAKI